MTSSQEQLFNTDYHLPVLLAEIAELLAGRKTVLDCTVGGAGHSIALLQGGAYVTGIDRDPTALKIATTRGAIYVAQGRFHTVLGDFTRLDELTELRGRTFEAILADLGVSSHQIDTDSRGFSFRPGVSLDMRMSGVGESAADFLNSAGESELSHVFRDYGDEPNARRLAAEVVRRRANRAMLTADDLVGAIRGVLGARAGPGDFARLFQAVRIQVNDELAGLERALPLLRDSLAPGGVLAMIAYHSGEDRTSQTRHAKLEYPLPLPTQTTYTAPVEGQRWVRCSIVGRSDLPRKRRHITHERVAPSSDYGKGRRSQRFGSPIGQVSPRWAWPLYCRVALLIGFVLLASAVIWRRSYGFMLSRELMEMDRHRTQLQGELVRLRGDIRDESSRAKLGSAVQRLGMRVPNDKQVRILPR